MGHYFTHEMKDETILVLNYRIEALTKRVDQLEKEQQITDLLQYTEFLEAQVEVLHKDISNIHFNETIGWTETN